MPVPPGTKGRMCDVAITRSKLRLGVKGQPPVLGEGYTAAGQTERCWNFQQQGPHTRGGTVWKPNNSSPCNVILLLSLL